MSEQEFLLPGRVVASNRPPQAGSHLSFAVTQE